MKKFQVVLDLFLIITASVLSAVGLYAFVNPANFAPSGIDGVAMMLQKLTDVNMGYISLAINIPLLIMAWFFISKKYVVYTTVFTVLSSIMLIFNMAMNSILKTTRNAVEARIITDNPQEFRDDIINNLKHGATIIDGTGMFTGESRKTIVTIINLRQMNDLIKLSRKHPNSFIYFSEVSGVWGNFRWNKSDIAK